MEAASSHKAMTTKVLVVASLLTGLSIILTRFFSVIVPLAGLPALRIGIGSIPIIISGILFGPFAGGLTGIVADLVGCMVNPQGTYFPGFTLSAALYGIIPGLIYTMIIKKKIRFNFLYINIGSMLFLVFGVIYIMFERNVLKLSAGQLFLYDKELSLIYLIMFSLILCAFIALPIMVNKNNKAVNKIYTMDKILFIVTITYMIISLGLNTLWLSIMFNKGFLIFLPGRILSGIVIIPIYSSIIFSLTKIFKHLKTSY
ncbi:folate family ECF transporter S component [Abyssisolibacter fermentans]|uniref:folate family ECF transporter S component n=1 Tax=Abyssisolibacter fermentans TaxID=1766203 RepID=UPI00082B660F|nr:folate family ECF transporter S component [Abyssisolibacter fermentans]